MSDDAHSSGITIPAETREKFGELVDMVLKSESMNDEERQYWINILPVMTPDQIQTLRDILDNEKRQLAAIDKKYKKELSAIDKEKAVAAMEEERTKRRVRRQSSEGEHEEEESKEEEDLLKKIEGF